MRELSSLVWLGHRGRVAEDEAGERGGPDRGIRALGGSLGLILSHCNFSNE